MTETWRPIPGWEHLYEVSDLGRVRSFARVYVRADGKPDRKPERIMRISAGKARRTGPGYGSVMLQGEGRKVREYVHRLVLIAFVGPAPAGMETLHRNGVPTDCRLVNLHWGTHFENGQDIVRHGNHAYASRTHCANGHPFDNENTSWVTRGKYTYRRCKACKNEQSRAAYHSGKTARA